MPVKKKNLKKKEPNSVMTNLNLLINSESCRQPQSRIKNIFKSLKEQLTEDEYQKLFELYSDMNSDDPDLNDSAEEYGLFSNYVKALTRTYSKKK